MIKDEDREAIQDLQRIKNMTARPTVPAMEATVVVLPRLLRKSNFDCQPSSPASSSVSLGHSSAASLYSGVSIIG